MAEITFDRDTMRVHFRTFGVEDYATFLKAKALPESETVFHPEDETYSIETPARFAALMGLQPVRRAYRYGQKERLRVHVPVIEQLEGDMLNNLFRKQDESERAIAEMEANYILARGGAL